MESLNHLWIHTANVYLQLFLDWHLRQSTPGACLKMVAFPLYKPWKGVDQVREGQGQSLVNLGTASHHLIDREAVTRMSGLYQMYLIS